MKPERHWPAPAKINLFLHVNGRRDDGYHELQTLYQFLDVGDRLRFAVRDDGVIRRTTNPELPAEDLAVRAARALAQASGCRLGVDIAIDKVIPAGAGLGGGSSDAATTLLALDRLWGTGLGTDALRRIAAGLGADVPVFVFGHAAWAEGIGERLAAAHPPERWYCVVTPPVHVGTATVFGDAQLTRNTPVITIRDFLAGRTRNDLEAVVRRRFPAVGEALDWLSSHAPARMTGSGAAVFAEVADRSAGERILARLPRPGRGFVARGINVHPLAVGG